MHLTTDFYYSQLGTASSLPCNMLLHMMSSTSSFYISTMQKARPCRCNKHAKQMPCAQLLQPSMALLAYFGSCMRPDRWLTFNLLSCM